ncbi:hypothetical protein J6G99_01030 [bacterium]|nr:hypothetical protein [bacterium]
MKRFILSCILILILCFIFLPKSTYSVNAFQCTIEERSGCCSHHGGVCGCSYGRAKCCDGSLSPSCGC